MVVIHTTYPGCFLVQSVWECGKIERYVVVKYYIIKSVIMRVCELVIMMCELQCRARSVTLLMMTFNTRLINDKRPAAHITTMVAKTATMNSDSAPRHLYVCKAEATTHSIGMSASSVVHPSKLSA